MYMHLESNFSVSIIHDYVATYKRLLLCEGSSDRSQISWMTQQGYIGLAIDIAD